MQHRQYFITIKETLNLTRGNAAESPSVVWTYNKIRCCPRIPTKKEEGKRPREETRLKK